MSITESDILERVRTQAGYVFASLNELPVISREIPLEIYRVLVGCFPEVDDGGLRCEITAKFQGKAVGALLHELLELLPSEKHNRAESFLYQAIAKAVTTKNVLYVWQCVEDNKPTEGFVTFAKLMLKFRAVRERVIARLLQIVHQGDVTENVMLGLANCSVDSVAEAAMRILGPHPELRHLTRRKHRLGRSWKSFFGGAESMVGATEIHSFNCDLETVLEDLEAEYPSALKRIVELGLTHDQIASIPIKQIGTLPGEPGVAIHRVDATELHVLIFERIPGVS